LKTPSEEIADLASVFSDSTRVRILLLLMRECGGFGMTTMDLSTRLGLAQPRVSSHLAILLKHGLVSVAEKGRQRIYTVSSGKVKSILDDFASLSSSGKKIASSGAIREIRSNSPLRQCRSCYDHLAGVAGVELLEKMVNLGWLSPQGRKEEGDGGDKILYRLTELGKKSLEDRGVNLDRAAKSNRTFAYGCLDWTERKPHLGGALGSAVLDSILSNGIVERKPRTRALKLAKPMSAWL
jgi:DNA-binding transcriptional ArsR family regulator